MMFSHPNNVTSPVTLNLFQGPSGRKGGASRRGNPPLGLLAASRFGRGENWTLKKVQGDENRGWSL